MLNECTSPEMAVLLMVYMAPLLLHSCYAIGSSSPLRVAVYTALLAIVTVSPLVVGGGHIHWVLIVAAKGCVCFSSHISEGNLARWTYIITYYLSIYHIRKWFPNEAVASLSGIWSHICLTVFEVFHKI